MERSGHVAPSGLVDRLVVYSRVSVFPPQGRLAMWDRLAMNSRGPVRCVGPVRHVGLSGHVGPSSHVGQSDRVEPSGLVRLFGSVPTLKGWFGFLATCVGNGLSRLHGRLPI